MLPFCARELKQNVIFFLARSMASAFLEAMYTLAHKDQFRSEDAEVGCKASSFSATLVQAKR
jgi:hypothetical protein